MPPEDSPPTDPTPQATPELEAEPEPRPTREPDPDPEPEAPGVGEAVGGVRAAFMRMLDAHITLLKAELAITGKELGLIVGLALGAFVIAVLAAILLYVGSFLFFGELLFGSMGWGIIHGTLLAAAFIGFVAINLAGGEMARYGWGAAIGVVVAIVLAAVLLSNAGNTGGESLRDWLNDTFVTEDLPFGDAWLVTLGGLVVVGLVGLVVAAIAGWRAELRGQALVALSVVGFVLGGLVGAVWFSTRYEAPDGVLGLAVTVGFLTWIIAGAVLAARGGFDPEARYADLIPRESIAAFGRTKDLMTEQWERQKNRMLGR
ncbi:MAG: hypothetical protein AB1Z67_04705 [Candidatus Limnocylindrales bacterium]